MYTRVFTEVYTYTCLHVGVFTEEVCQEDFEYADVFAACPPPKNWCRERVIHRQPTGPNPLSHRDDFSGPEVRQVDFEEARICGGLGCVLTPEELCRLII